MRYQKAIYKKKIWSRPSFNQGCIIDNMNVWRNYQFKRLIDTITMYVKKETSLSSAH